jgi:endonuclease/exonuclease/phosphatase family metal-dependent hydrolase
MKKNKTTFFDKVTYVLAILAAIALICGAMAGSNNPTQHIYIAFAGLAYPFILLVNVIFLVYWLLRKKWIAAGLTVIIIGAGWHTVTATFGLFGNSGENVKSSPKYLRLMTYNVHNFRPYGFEIDEKVKEKMLDIVKNQNPDIICFQEFFTRYKGPFDTVDSLKSLLNTRYYYFEPTSRSVSEAIGLAIFSKYPIKNKGFIAFENSGNGSIYVDLEINNQMLRVYDVHLQSISFDKEDYTYIDKVKDMDPQVGSTKRILKMLKNAFQKRAVQVKLMKTHMKSCTIPYIITGDFNDTPASYAVTKLTDSLNNAFVKKGQGVGRTYNGKFPNFQIDYIATTKDFDIINYKIIEAKLSDHFPVRSDVYLKKQDK